mgnify:FL=1
MWMQDKYDIFLPFDKVIESKSKDKNGVHNIFVSGWASTPAWDYQGESIDPCGLDASYLFNHGFVDYEHNQELVIGVPTSKSYVDPQRGLYLEAELFGNSPKVKEIMKLADNLSKTESKRTLGFSIEGIVDERDEDNPDIVRNLRVVGVAVTKNPANPEATWENIQKSMAMEAGYSVDPKTNTGGASLRVEDFCHHLHDLSEDIKGYHANGGDIDELRDLVGKSLDESQADSLTKTFFLQLCAGLDNVTASNLVMSTLDSGNSKEDNV